MRSDKLPVDINKLNIDALNGLSDDERNEALQIIQQFATEGKSELFDNLQYSDFEEVPVDIDTFIHDRHYLGNGLYDPEGRFTVFPYWEEKLKEIFPDNFSTRYNTIILTGAIGIGKSTLAVICLLYLLYRLLCLKDPYLYYGLQPIDKISISLINITLENAKGVALDKMNQMLIASEWFMKHGQMSGITNLKYVPNKHIEIITASSNNQIIGRAVFSNFADEVNFMGVADVAKAKKKEMQLINQIDNRMVSRFQRTKADGNAYLPTLNIIASSKDKDQSFLEDYIEMKQKNESSTTLVVNEPQWVVDSRKDSPIKFYVAIGNKILPNEILPANTTEEDLNAYRAKGYSRFEAVPIGYLDKFQNDVDQALAEIAGIATASTLKFISGERLEKIKTNSYKNPFIKDVITVGNDINDNLQYANFFDISVISPEDLARPLFIHLDMSLTGDKTGIAGVWILGRREHIQQLNQPLNIAHTQTTSVFGDEDSAVADDNSRDLVYKVAFSVSIEAPKKSQISFEKNRNFIRWLRNKGFSIKCISADTFQSASLLQELKMDGFNTATISVDRVDKQTKNCAPYAYFKAAIYERRIQLYSKCDLLTTEITELEKESDGHINHPDHGTKGSKDQSDATCGAVYSASRFAEEYSYSYGDNIIATLESNDLPAEVNINSRKQQMIEDLQADLLGTWAEIHEADTLEAQQKRQELQAIKDLQDGIFNL